MNMSKKYKQIEPKTTSVKESTVAYTFCRGGNCYEMSEMRSDIKSAVSGEELINRLRIRIKALYK